jgi:hypothetical protein
MFMPSANCIPAMHRGCAIREHFYHARVRFGSHKRKCLISYNRHQICCTWHFETPCNCGIVKGSMCAVVCILDGVVTAFELSCQRLQTRATDGPATALVLRANRVAQQ